MMIIIIILIIMMIIIIKKINLAILIRESRESASHLSALEWAKPKAECQEVGPQPGNEQNRKVDPVFIVTTF